MDSTDCNSKVLSDELIEFQFRLPTGVKPAACWPGPSLLSKILGYAILWVVLAALSARFGIHFAGLFRRKQAKKKLQAALLRQALAAKSLDAGGQPESTFESSKGGTGEASAEPARSSVLNITNMFMAGKAGLQAAVSPKGSGHLAQSHRQGIPDVYGAAIPKLNELRATQPAVLVYIIRSVQFVGLSYSICALQTREMCAAFFLCCSARQLHAA
jgi:hypothetical protein